MNNGYELVPTVENLVESLIDNPINNQNEICCICLEQTDINCKKLSCNCIQKFHVKCIKEIEKNNLTKCPSCRKTIHYKKNSVSNNEESTIYDYYDILINRVIHYFCLNQQLENNCIIVIIKLLLTFITSIIIIMCAISIYFAFITIINIVVTYIFELKKNTYCDNVNLKCDYYKTSGIIIHNTINSNIDIDNFSLKYILTNIYNYENNKTCINSDTHDYLSYDIVNEISNNIIGNKHNIFVPYKYDKFNNTICKTYHEQYNPNKYIINQCDKYNVLLWFILCFNLFLFGCFKDEYQQYIQNLINSHIYIHRIKAYIIKIITIISYIIHISLMTIISINISIEIGLLLHLFSYNNKM